MTDSSTTENIAGCIILIFGIAFILLFVVLISHWQQQEGDQQCINQYGEEWHYQGGIYQNDICINKEGDIKGL